MFAILDIEICVYYLSCCIIFIIDFEKTITVFNQVNNIFFFFCSPKLLKLGKNIGIFFQLNDDIGGFTTRTYLY